MKFTPGNSLGFLVKQAGRALRSRVHQKIKARGYDITMEQGGVLMRLWMKDGQSQMEIGQFLGKDKTTMARVLDVMEKTLLVVRIPSKEDKRSKLIYLTRKGKETREVVTLSLKETIDEAVEGVPENEVEICKEVLRKVIENIGLDNNLIDQC